MFLHGHWGTLGREVSALASERRWSVAKVVYGEVLSYLLPQALIDLAKQAVGRNSGLGDRFSQTLSADAQACRHIG